MAPALRSAAPTAQLRWCVRAHYLWDRLPFTVSAVLRLPLLAEVSHPVRGPPAPGQNVHSIVLTRAMLRLITAAGADRGRVRPSRAVRDCAAMLWPLQVLAAGHGHLDCVRLLLHAGASHAVRTKQASRREGRRGTHAYVACNAQLARSSLASAHSAERAGRGAVSGHRRRAHARKRYGECHRVLPALCRGA